MDSYEQRDPENSGGLDRRTLFKRGAVVGGAAVWATPVVQSLAAPAWATGTPIGVDCGRFTGGGRVDVEGNNKDAEFRGTRQLDDGTVGFELHCSPDVVPNNLVVSFFDAAGDKVTFHLDALTTVTCTFEDDPTPPAAPVNTLRATGTGHTTGACTGDATIDFELVDRGEPGGPAPDTIEAVITYACGEFSTDGPKPIFGGNIQAHRSTGSKGC